MAIEKLTQTGKETLRSDGNAIDVTIDKTVEKGDVGLFEKFHGIMMETASSGDTVAMEIAQRVHEVNVGEITADKGDLLYLDENGDITDTNTDRLFAKVVIAKDANNIAWLLILPQVDL
jgi:predicted RNA-binding protein with TRAM domain